MMRMKIGRKEVKESAYWPRLIPETDILENGDDVPNWILKFGIYLIFGACNLLYSVRLG